jgi:hypothetical protein
MVNYWLPLAYNDPALLHTLIGCAASFVTRTNWNRGYPVFIRHLNNAMVIINQRLADSTDSVSDETLVVVATIAMMKVRMKSILEDKVTDRHAEDSWVP